MDINKNYYDILGIPKTATEEEIKKAYKKLALQHHPDRNNGDKSSEDKFKEVNEAQSILCGDERQKYDMMSPHGANYQPGFGGGGFHFSNGGDGVPFTGDPFFDSILRQHFGGGFGGFRRNSTIHEDLDIGIDVNVSLSDTYNNRTIPIKYNRYVKCDDCQGTGFNLKSEKSICSTCSGSGKDQYGISCINCSGTGNVYKEQCSKCNGEKVILIEMTFQINNTYKIESDVDNMYPGQGHHSKYYNRAGSLHLHIQFSTDLDYRRTSQGLLTNIDVHYQDAIDGFNYMHNHLDDKVLKIKVPAGTKDKDMIRIKEKGMLIDGVNREPLLFRINIVIDYDRVKKKRTKIV